jgi:hypothetical protein
MGELGGRARLTPKSLASFRKVSRFGCEYFYGNETFQSIVTSEVDCPHSSSAEEADDLVLAPQRFLQFRTQRVFSVRRRL